MYMIRQTKMLKAQSVVHEPSSFEVEIVIEKLKRDKSPSIHQILAEVIHYILRCTNVLFLF